MTTLPKLLILDRDGVITHSTNNPDSPFYYLTDYRDFILKPNVPIAFRLLETLRRESGMKVVLATKQRCISKGIVARSRVNLFHELLEQDLAFEFNAIYVEETKELKTGLFRQALLDFGVVASEVLLIDDSDSQCHAARSLGIPSVWTKDLYAEVAKML